MTRPPSAALRYVTVALLTTGLLALASCESAGPPLVGVSPFPPRPVRSVAVYGFPHAVQQGDTFTFGTAAFDSAGNGTASEATANWTLTDPTLVSTVGVGAYGRTLQVRGLRPGLVRAVATINGVNGSDSLRVLPPLAPFRFEPATVTLRRGDSVGVRLFITDREGAPIRSLIVVWEPQDVRLVRGACCRDSATIVTSPNGGLGTTVLRVTSAQITAELPVTIIER